VTAALPPEAAGKPLEIWWQDEARVGQQGTTTRVWAERGSRPSAPKDCRYAWAYLFGAVCPARGVGAGLVLPAANTAMMNLHLAEISAQVVQGAHAVVIMDGAAPAGTRPGANCACPPTSPRCGCRPTRRS
jgi:DDE superfamily endonuclease